MKKQGLHRHHTFLTKRLFFSIWTHLNSHRGQMLAEYSIVILVVVSAATTMMIFTKRVIQARAHDAQQKVMQVAGKSLGHKKALNMEYEPYYYESSTVTVQDQTDSVFKSFDQRYHKEQQSDRTSNTYSTQHAPRN